MKKVYKNLCDKILDEFRDELYELKDRNECYNCLSDFLADIKGYLVGEVDEMVDDYIDSVRL